jgi:catechol 2,3-dioxygenase-like lactoylglutathione lyase family enzyme
MKRFHVHVGVKDLNQSIAFYSALFGEQPSKLKTDYAKWMLEDPRINFAISTRTGTDGVDHLGLQVDEDAELYVVTERLKQAELQVFDEGQTTCCYAESNKAWVIDPSGIAWETYKNLADADIYSSKSEETADSSESCCGPEESAPGSPSCC